MKFAVAFTLLFFGTTRLVRGDSDESIMACLEIFKPSYVDAMCCENLKSIDMFDNDFKECTKKETSEELTCSDYECLLKKRGLLEDGEIIEDKTRAFLDDLAKDNPGEKKALDRVKSGCLDGQYEEYPPDENCMALKFYVCAYTNIMLGCDSWKDTDTCKEAANLAKKCEEGK